MNRILQTFHDVTEVVLLIECSNPIHILKSKVKHLSAAPQIRPTFNVERFNV